jgi:hypothetical protein
MLPLVHILIFYKRRTLVQGLPRFTTGERAHVIFPLEKGILGVSFLFSRRNIHEYKYSPDTLMNFL